MYRTDMPVCNLNTPRDSTISKMYALTSSTQRNDENCRHEGVTTKKVPKQMRKLCEWQRKCTSEEIATYVGGSLVTSIDTTLWLREMPLIRVVVEVGNRKQLVSLLVTCALAASC